MRTRRRRQVATFTALAAIAALPAARASADDFLVTGWAETVATAPGFDLEAKCTEEGEPSLTVRHLGYPSGALYVSAADETPDGFRYFSGHDSDMLIAEGGSTGELIYRADDGQVVTAEFASSPSALGSGCMVAGSTRKLERADFEEFVNLGTWSRFAKSGGGKLTGYCEPVAGGSRVLFGGTSETKKALIAGAAYTESGVVEGGLYPPPRGTSTSFAFAADDVGLGDVTYASSKGNIVSAKVVFKSGGAICDAIAVVDSAAKKSDRRVLYEGRQKPSGPASHDKFFSKGPLSLYGECDSGGDMHIYARSKIAHSSIFLRFFQAEQSAPFPLLFPEIGEGEAGEEEVILLNGPSDTSGEFLYVPPSGQVMTINWSAAILQGYEDCLFTGIAR